MWTCRSSILPKKVGWICGSIKEQKLFGFSFLLRDVNGKNVLYSFIKLFRPFTYQAFCFKLLFDLFQSNSSLKIERPKRLSFKNINKYTIYKAHVCQKNLVYHLAYSGHILRHLCEFRKIRLLFWENTRFLLEEGQYGYLKERLWPIWLTKTNIF